MDMSAQPRPTLPALTKTGLLYAALIMEEASEAFRSLGTVLLEDEDGDRTQDEEAIMLVLRNQAFEMEAASKHLRHHIGKLPEGWGIALGDEHAVALFDDTTDITVVNSGFALALGLPGGAGYHEVAASNQSKANPDTGVIDKDPSGKWIKGRNYREPNLAAVLARHLDRVQEGTVANG